MSTTMPTITMPVINDWVNKPYLTSTSRLQQSFYTGKPFSHLVLHDFFQQDKAEQLRAALLEQEWQEKDPDLFRFHQTTDLTLSKHPVLASFCALFALPEFRSLITSITGVENLASIDASGQRYTSGDYLLPHDDRLEGRKIAYVVNLTKEFEEQDGGQLQFFAVDEKTGHPTTVEVSFVPTFNTLFLFRVSKRSFHQVAEVVSSKERLSIAGWFHG